MAVELIWINVAVPIKVLPCDTAAGGQVVVVVGGRALVLLLPTEKLFVSSEAFCFRQSKGRDEGQTLLSAAVLSFGVFFLESLFISAAALGEFQSFVRL